jgi:hypothetical protein
MWRSHRGNKLVVISYFLFYPSSTNCIFSPLSCTIFIYSFSTEYLFIASLHLIKYKKIKEINRTLEKDEGNFLYFWRFWSVEWAREEQDMVKNESGVEWRPSLSVRPKIYGRLATFPLFSLLSLLLSSYLSQPLHHGDKLKSFWPHRLAARPPTLAGRPHLGSPIKRLPRGASSFIP